MKKNNAALEQAIELGRKSLADFVAEEKDLLGSVNALKAAITVLSKHHGGSLLQIPKSQLVGVAATLQRELAKHSEVLLGVFSPTERKTAMAFIQASDYFDADPTFKQSYAPQSGEIFGILRQMKETFESNLAALQKEHAGSQKASEELQAAKLVEIDAGKDQLSTKTSERTETDSKLVADKGSLKDTRNSLTADEQFLLMLKEKCQMTDNEWEERQKTRQQEMEAVSKALSILSTDDAHNTFTRTFTFVQKSTTTRVGRRNQASKLLAVAADKLKSPRLSALALKVRLDAFVRVKKAIDDMIAQLSQQKDDESTKRDFCIDAFNENKVQVEQKDAEKKTLVQKKATLASNIESLNTEIGTLQDEIAEINKEMKKAGEDRDLANKENRRSIADHRATQKLLQAALKSLQEFYNKGAAMLQRSDAAPPPPGFERYENNAASGNVMQLLQTIMRDSKQLEAELARNDGEEQTAYEAVVKDSNLSIEEKRQGIDRKSKDKATSEADFVEAKQDIEANRVDVEDLSNQHNELEQNCDFLLENFDHRQTALTDEVEALRQAKAILSGAKFF